MDSDRYDLSYDETTRKALIGTFKTTSQMIDEEALQIVVDKMAKFRAGCDVAFIRQEIEAWLETGREPLAEISQDIVWAYQQALEQLGRSAG